MSAPSNIINRTVASHNTLLRTRPSASSPISVWSFTGASAESVLPAAASPETMRLFAEAQRRGLVFIQTRADTTNGRSTVEFRLYSTSGGSISAISAVPAIVIDRQNPGTVTLNGAATGDFHAVRNHRLAAALSRHLNMPDNADPVALPPPVPAPPPRSQRSATDMTECPAVRRLVRQMGETGFQVCLMSSSNNRAVYQVFQSGIQPSWRERPGTAAIGAPIIVTNPGDSANRDQVLSTQISARLASTDFRWRRNLVEFIAAQQDRRNAIANIARYSREDLPAEARLQGQEMRLADALHAHLNPHRTQCGSTLSPTQLHDIRLPLLHALQRIDAEHPGYLNAVAATSPTALQHFTLELAGEIHAERQRAGAVPLLTRGMQIVGLANHEEMFSLASIEALGRRYGVVNTPTEHRVFLLKGAANSAQQNPKQRFLEWTEIVGENTARPTMLWLHGHGSATGIAFSNGHGAGNHISPRELAESLVRRQSRDGSTVQLSHVNLVLDCCYAPDFRENFETALHAAARARGATIGSMPNTVTSCNRGTVGWVWTYTNGTAQSTLTDIFQGITPRSTGTLTLGDFMQADAAHARTLEEQIRTWTVRSRNSSPGVFQDQDSAVTGSIPLDTRTIIDRIRSRLTDQGTTVPAPIGSRPNRVPRPLEISHLDRTSFAGGERC